MKTNKYLVLLVGLIFMLQTMSSCGEDVAGYDELEANEWLHPYGASESDKALQQKFYAGNGVYLLFNDTLKKERTGTNPDGTPFYKYEAVELSYLLTGNNNGEKQVFAFHYIQDDQNKKYGADFIQNKLLPHLSANLKPLSFLLVEKIDYYVSNSSTYYEFKLTNPSVYAGTRCTAIAAAGISEMTPQEQTTFCNTLLKAVVNSKLSTIESSIFDEFYGFCNDYYGTFALNGDASALLEMYPTPYDLGLLDGGYYDYGSPYGFPMYNIKDKTFDLADYTNAVFDYTEDAFYAKFGQYPKVMAKYHILKGIFENIGIVF